MPNRAYAILYRGDAQHPDIGYLYFPIKLATAPAFPGKPQFFGGGRTGAETDLQTIVREARQESNNQVTVNSLGRRLHTATVNGDQYNFYVVEDFSGQHFLGALPGNNEMASIERYQVQAGGENDIHDLLAALHIGTDVAFAESETYTAFERALEFGQEEEAE
jgi:8-oxo-dGTP diphosphatase